MNWRLLLSVSAVVIVAAVFVVGRSVGPLCPTTGKRTSNADIANGALVFAAAELQRFNEIYALGGGSTAGVPLRITPEMVAAEQPDCCTITRNPPEAFVTRTERVHIRQPGPEVHAYFKVSIDAPALLPPMVVSYYEMIVSVDVCGQPVQDWLDIEMPASDE